MQFAFVRDRVLRRLSFGLYKGDWHEREQRDLTRTRGGVFAFDFKWQLARRADLSDLAAALKDRCLSVDSGTDSERRVVLHGGSQLRTRFYGGYFVDPRHLPIRAELVTDSPGHGGDELRLHVRDTLGVARRDIALGDRYEVAAEAIRDVVDDRLEVSPATERA